MLWSDFISIVITVLGLTDYSNDKVFVTFKFSNELIQYISISTANHIIIWRLRISIQYY